MLLYSCSETPLARCIFQLNIPFFMSNKTNEMDVKSYINELYLINDEHPFPFSCIIVSVLTFAIAAIFFE